MDKGAHFYRCDFQVHTPRDPQWTGDGAVTDTERQAYAAAFIAACREKGLHGVAISDHHDMAFVPYIREAAKNERDEKGQLVPAQSRISVFPAMELTLAVPCQAIIIFDAEFPGDLFPLAMNALAIIQNPIAEVRCRQAERLNILSLSAVCDKLDEHEYLRDRYIVLPNVSERGTATLLRSGHSTHYREMPCVGAYLDGSCEQLGRGNLTILSGRNAEYGSKKVGLFQTSDNRRRDFADLGTHSTWVSGRLRPPRHSGRRVWHKNPASRRTSHRCRQYTSPPSRCRTAGSWGRST
jgi:type III restriction enzyme